MVMRGGGKPSQPPPLTRVKGQPPPPDQGQRSTTSPTLGQKLTTPPLARVKDQPPPPHDTYRYYNQLVAVHILLECILVLS